MSPQILTGATTSINVPCSFRMVDTLAHKAMASHSRICACFCQGNVRGHIGWRASVCVVGCEVVSSCWLLTHIIISRISAVSVVREIHNDVWPQRIDGARACV
jgi:hypothetical protein